jgi:hypothetical protein
VPESLVLDVTVTAGDAEPSTTVPQTCSDGIDNDGDTAVDTDDTSLGCNPAHASYTGDTDKDGKLDASDNCPTVWNPEQTNTDGVFKGDACDPDDDNDGFTDVTEWGAGSDPLLASSKPEVCDAADNDGDTVNNEGFPDANSDGTADCMENDAGQCTAPNENCDVDGDTVTNGTDLNDDSWEAGSTHNDMYPDTHENYVGTSKDLKCWLLANPTDADPFDAYKDGKSNAFDIMQYYAAPQAYGTDVTKDDIGYNKRLDLFGPDGKINAFDIMQYYASPQAYGQTCPYGK